MAYGPVFTVDGTVLAVERLRGTGKVSGEPYDFRIAKVLAGKADILEVVLPDEFGTPPEGEIVQWQVRVSAQGNTLRCSLLLAE